MRKSTVLAIVVALTIAGFALRVYHLEQTPFRGDEAFAAQRWAGQPLAESLRNIATLEPHPPLTYALFRAWGLMAGINEFTLRLLPALVNTLGIAAIYALGHRLGGRKLGLLAALLWAVNPYQIWQSQDARNYAIWAGLSLVTVWLGLRVVERGRRVDWLLYLAAAVVTNFVFYMELFALGALSLYVLAVRWRDWRFLRRWIAAHAVVVAAVLAVFWIIQGHLFTGGDYGGTVGGFDPGRWLTWFWPTLAFGETLPAAFVRGLWPALLALLVFGWWVVWRGDKRQGLFLGLLGVIPLLLLGMVSLFVEVFHPRYVIVAAPVYVLVVSGLILRIRVGDGRRVVRQVVPLVIVGGWLGISSFSLINHYFSNDYTKSANWPSLTRYLHDNVKPDDLVIQTSVDAAFGYYYDAPAIDIGLPENPQESRKDIIDELEKDRDTFDSIWVVGTTFADWPNAGIVEQWMLDNMQRVRVTSTSHLPIQQFMRWDVAEDEIEKTPTATFDQLAELVGVRIFEPPEPTGELTVWVYWRSLDTSQEPLKVFVHLTGAVNPATGTPLWAQDDHFPQNGRVGTDTWPPQKVYRDVYTLPVASVPTGEYAVNIGFYNPTTNTRVPASDGADSVQIGQVTLP